MLRCRKCTGYTIFCFLHDFSYVVFALCSNVTLPAARNSVHEGECNRHVLLYKHGYRERKSSRARADLTIETIVFPWGDVQLLISLLMLGTEHSANAMMEQYIERGRDETHFLRFLPFSLFLECIISDSGHECTIDIVPRDKPASLASNPILNPNRTAQQRCRKFGIYDQRWAASPRSWRPFAILIRLRNSQSRPLQPHVIENTVLLWATALYAAPNGYRCFPVLKIFESTKETILTALTLNRSTSCSFLAKNTCLIDCFSP